MPALFSTTKLQNLSDWFVSHLLTDRCAIQREVNNVYTTVAGLEAVPCALVDGPTRTEKDISDETTGASLGYVLMPRNTVVYSPDRLVINSIKYRVFDIPDPGTFEVLRRVEVVRFPQRGGAP